MTANKRNIGNAGEDFAVERLIGEGYRILCRNFDGKHGEIDIVAEKNDRIVFVEVKLRKILSQNPAEALNSEKMLHIVNTAHEFMCEYKENLFIQSLDARFDLIEILTVDGKISAYRHTESICL